jgi:antitoxin YefM
MITATISDFRKNIKQYFARVTKNFETLIINRGKNSGVVVISLEEYNSLLTTQNEMSSEKNKARLDSAIKKFKDNESFNKIL